MTNYRVESSSGRAARKMRLALMGPAFIAAIGYIDPGNFATNRCQLRLSATVGCRLGQPDGDADSDTVCQTGDCHR